MEGKHTKHFYMETFLLACQLEVEEPGTTAINHLQT